ncbi:deoxyribonuclease IV [Mesobacillus maritimus]|uniref:Deoxyribonuclease IV n=1 Tax=Mesobacillus maritimus TaxID=1643336 RepID=A0ABS7K1T5_9BACI|nr:deoxyribonuclease IV [Mesobacillus maritimus]MBY0096149.1 deoxyribonuclease IV [Mesobacillus maritimus]
MIIGSHVSIRDGYLAAAKRAVANHASAFQYFPKNPRSLSVKAFNHEDAQSCKAFSQQHQLHSVAHTPYSTNLTPDDDKKELTIQSILNDLDIANACGSIGVVVHFANQISESDPLASYHLMLEMLNNVLGNWDGECKILLENNAGTKGGLGTTFEELVQVRNLCEFPEKIGFCFDTCHAFASGLWTGENTKEMLSKGEELGYWKDLEVIHLNNSKYPTGSKKDRHANIFKNGYIDELQLKSFVLSAAVRDVPLVLETPDDEGITHKEEIHLLVNQWS